MGDVILPHLRQMVGFIDESGKVYGQLHVIRYVKSEGTGRRKSAMFECACSCGEIVVVKGQQLRNGQKSMCAACFDLAKCKSVQEA
jgi:hypothetical protein